MHACLAGAAEASQLANAAKQLLGSILHQDSELLVMNKPAGLPVQGGLKLSVSLDRVLAAHFKTPEGHTPRQAPRVSVGAIAHSVGHAWL